MMSAFHKIVRDLLTGRDNATHDVARHAWLYSMVGIAVIVGWHLWHGVAVSIVEFAEACGIIAAGHGAAIGVKGKTEPQAES